MGADKAMVKNGRATEFRWSGTQCGGCSCCNSPARRRRAIRPVKRAEERKWKAEVKKDAD